MDRPTTPSGRPDYGHGLPSYRRDQDDHDEQDTPIGQNAAAVRLLTSVDGLSGLDDSQSYVYRPRKSANPSPSLPTAPSSSPSSPAPAHPSAWVATEDRLGNEHEGSRRSASL